MRYTNLVDLLAILTLIASNQKKIGILYLFNLWHSIYFICGIQQIVLNAHNKTMYCNASDQCVIRSSIYNMTRYIFVT